MGTSCRVGFDAGPVHSAYSGIGQYVRQLFPAMSQINPIMEWVAYTSNTQTTHLNGLAAMASLKIKSRKSPWAPSLKADAHERLDLFHGTNFKAGNYGQRKTVLTIHDLWLDRYPAYSKKLLGQGLASWKTKKVAARADKIITVSQFSKREIQEVLDIPSEKIVVIYHGCSPEMFPDRDVDRWCGARARLNLPDRPYLLFVGGAEPRKNHRVLFEAFAQSTTFLREVDLVVIGDETVRGESLYQSAQDLGISHVVKCPGSLSTDDLRLVYSNAVALVFPSRYEGFGIPLLEAMACGTPIVTGENTAMPEVAGDAALYANVQNVEQMRTVLEQLVGDSTLQEHLRRRGLERVKLFTWERAARETLAVYQEIC